MKKDKAFWFLDVQMETYRRSESANPFEESDDEELEIRLCDALLSVYDIQMVTDTSKDGRIAVMLTDSSIVSVVGTIQEFKDKLRGIE